MYAVITFDPSTFSPRALYTFNGLGSGAGGQFVTPDLDLARDHAQSMSGARGRTTLYAVFDVGDCSFAARGMLAISRPWVAFGPPVFVPDASEALNRAHTWREAYVPAMPAMPAAPAAAPSPAVRFEVRSGENGTNRDTWGAVAEFDNGKDAGAWVGANKARYTDAGKSLVIVKVELDAVAVDWRAREAGRIASGEYLPLPGDWAAKIAEVYPDHFVHLASSNKLRVAFTESESSGERDRQKVLTPAEYAARFFRSDDLPGAYWYSDTRASFISAIHGDGIKPLITPLGDVEAMVQVYRDTERGSAGGCMSYSAGHFSTGGVHPVTVYAMGGELAVALLRGCVGGVRGQSGDIDLEAELLGAGAVLARCLVWIKNGENMEYGRVYGGCSIATRALRTSLEAQGFTSGNCIGARIAKLECDDGFVMPYLDIGGGSVEDCGDYYRAGGNISASQTSGLLDDDRCECEHCGDMSDADDMRSVYVSRRSCESWCDSCVSGDAFYCSEADEYVSDEQGAELLRSNGHHDTVAVWVLERGDIDAVLTDDGWIEGGFHCEDCSEGFGPDDANHWYGGETGNDNHGEGDCICNDCHAARVELVAELAEAEAEAEVSPELPLASAA